MFRRFMIVCWVVFCFSVVASAVAWNAEDAARSETFRLLESAYQHPAMFSDVGEEISSKMRDEDGNTIGDIFREHDWRVEDRDRLEDLRGNSITVAFSLLLWNIIWHVGHWVWMGRKVE